MEKTRETSAARARGQSALPQRYLLRVLLAIGAMVTVFRGAYEQMGNTVALWAQIGIDRHAGEFTIPMTWFQSLDPLLVFLMTPALLAYWRRGSLRGAEPTAIRKMARGALIVGAAYLLIAAVSAVCAPHQASWLWLALFFVIFTLGELYILPTGLGLFARLAPARFAATTVAAWFFAIFTGSLLAGAVGTLWSLLSSAAFFCVLAGLALVSSAGLRAMERATDRVEEDHASQAIDLPVTQPAH